jgi:hypothetical protein
VEVFAVSRPKNNTKTPNTNAKQQSSLLLGETTYELPQCNVRKRYEQAAKW